MKSRVVHLLPIVLMLLLAALTLWASAAALALTVPMFRSFPA